MNIKINAELEGKEIIEYFVNILKSKGIEAAWKKEDLLPLNTKILVFSDKAGKDIEITPDKLKITFNQ